MTNRIINGVVEKICDKSRDSLSEAADSGKSNKLKEMLKNKLQIPSSVTSVDEALTLVWDWLEDVIGPKVGKHFTVLAGVKEDVLDDWVFMLSDKLPTDDEHVEITKQLLAAAGVEDNSEEEEEQEDWEAEEGERCYDCKFYQGSKDLDTDEPAKCNNKKSGWYKSEIWPKWYKCEEFEAK